MDSDHLRAAAEKVLRSNLSGMERIGGGRNSQVYKVSSATQDFVLKHYHTVARLDVEFSAFEFLRAKGVSVVPEAVAADRDGLWAIYTYAPGEIVKAANLRESDIDECVSFIRSLRHIRHAKEVQPAAEAFFCLDKIESNVASRFRRLEKRERNSQAEGDLALFLESRFQPAFERTMERATDIYRECGLAPEEELAQDCRVLSPSDFGFHNAVRTHDGMMFFDFEYFGWDDPAKLISDFLLHPGMDVPMVERERFRDGVITVMDDPVLRRRQGALYPLFGLKWCMILLNEFLNTDYSRRAFAGVVEEREEILRCQLVKSKNMLETVERALSE